MLSTAEAEISMYPLLLNFTPNSLSSSPYLEAKLFIFFPKSLMDLEAEDELESRV